MTNKTNETEPLEPFIEIGSDEFGNAIFTLSTCRGEDCHADILTTHKPRKITQALKALEDISGQRFVSDSLGSWVNVVINYRKTDYQLTESDGEHLSKLDSNTGYVELTTDHMYQTYDETGEKAELIPANGLILDANY